MADVWRSADEKGHTARSALSVALALAIEEGHAGVTQRVYAGRRVVCMIVIMPGPGEAPPAHELLPESPGSDPYARGRAALSEIGSWPWPDLSSRAQEKTPE